MRVVEINQEDRLMIVDARSVPENDTIETDVCIVGAGVAGITLAREFASQPFQVCLLESGHLKFSEETQSLCAGEDIGHPYFALDRARARFFGGTANFWDIDIGEGRIGVRLRPLDAIDFEERECVPYSGWPFGKAELEPFYERAQKLFKVEPSTYDVKDWENPATPCLPLNGRVQTVIFKFGWRELFTQEYRYEVTQYAENILTFLFANVTEIETNEPRKAATRLRVACLHGNKFWVSAKIFILAVGGIEAPRLLLLSNRQQAAGLGNQRDLVGRYFMEHLHFWSGVYVPSNRRIWERAGLYKGIHKVREIPVIGKLALSESVLRRERLLNQNIQLIPDVLSISHLYPRVRSKSIASFDAFRSAVFAGKMPDHWMRHIANIMAEPDDIARNTYRKVKRQMSEIFNERKIQGFRLAHMSEQTPNPDSRVALSTERDALGQNCVRLNWQPSEIDFLSVVRTQEIIDAELRRAGLGRLYIQLRGPVAPPGLHGGYHHMGTTRMHVDPKKGVVDHNCRVHGISNLFIAGPSVFPTGGYANPTLTNAALTLRLADYVKGIMAA